MEKRVKHRIRYALASISAMLITVVMAFSIAISPAAAAGHGEDFDFAAGQMPAHHQHGDDLGFSGHGSGKNSATVMTAAESAAGGKVTILVYMNGSDLESYGGAATADISEMLGSGVGKNANVVIETVGTREWQDFGIASDRAQRYAVEDGKLTLVDDSLDQLDATAPETLSGFLSWGKANYPADRYFLVLWDHGAGPVYGFGYDEFQSEESALTLDEMKQALDEKSDIHFDFIGMDCCIMGSLETCAVLAPYCDYAVLSEDFEPGIGWHYEKWMSALEANPEIGTAELGRIIVDDMVDAAASDEENGDAVLALIDESKVPALYGAWEEFAYANSDALLSEDISRKLEWNPTFESDKAIHVDMDSLDEVWFFDNGYDCDWDCGDCDFYGYDEQVDKGWFYTVPFAAFGIDHDYGDYYDYGCDDDDWDSFWEDWAYDGSYVTMTDYFVTDLDAAAAVGNETSNALKEALDDAIVYCKSTDGDADLCGLGITLPYGDGEFYDALEGVFAKCGFDAHYIEWLEAFTGVAA